MARYDAGWDRYDRPFRGPPRGPERGAGPSRGGPGSPGFGGPGGPGFRGPGGYEGGGGPGGFRGPQRGYPGPDGGYGHSVDPGYGGDFRPHPGRGGHVDREREREDGLTGPDERFAGGGWEDRDAVYGPGRYGLGPYHQRLHTRRRPDDELRESVEEALFYDTWVDADAIRVQVADGIVTLRGELPDYHEVRYATDDAWDVDGVRGVRTELQVRADRPSQERGGPEGGDAAGRFADDSEDSAG
ncbi:MAG: hypothetical protein JWM27_431 [Gemmatimonadetes bacterium]|nr:hypothetical protein [Gemmatimonadota bacterium]